RPVVALDDVVGDEPMTTHHEIERALALADAARAHEQEADAEHVDEHAVQALSRGEALIEDGVQRRDDAARSLRRDEEGRACRIGSLDEVRAREALAAAREDDGGEVLAEEAARGPGGAGVAPTEERLAPTL